MTTLTFDNGAFYPTLRADLDRDLTDERAEIVIDNFHRDDATVIDAAAGKVAYDLDGVPQFSEQTYDVQFEIFDSNDNKVATLPSTPITLDVQGTGEHTAGSGDVQQYPDVTYDTVNAQLVDSKQVDAEMINSQQGHISDEFSSDKHIHPQFTQDFGTQSPNGRSDYDISVVNGGWSFDEFLIDASSQVASQLEGVAYHDGHIYFGEETGDSTPATIRKYTVDGVDTGETFTFGSGQANHTNSMDWYQGPNDDKPLLWVSDAAGATDKDYIVDFENGTVVDVIDHNGAANSEGIRGFIHATNGKMYLLYTAFGDTGYDNAHLVDLEGARTDGQTDGNVVTTLSHDGITSREQSGVWRNGYYYFCDHRIAAKVRMPFADQLRDGYPVMAGENVEWVIPRPGTFELEDFAYNPDRDEWYVGQASSSAGVHRVSEGWGENVPVNWDNWNTTAGGVDYSRCLNPDASVNGNKQTIRAIGFEANARVEVWVYDHGRTSGESNYVAVNDDGASDDNHTIAIKTDETNGASNYYRWNSTDTWEDTGVSRPANPQWVGFAFHATGSSMELSISTDLGNTWQDAGAKTTNATKISLLTHRAVSGSFKVGRWNIQLLETPTI